MDYYVSQQNGNDGNSGVEAQSWRTIQKAANTMVAGDTVYIQNGTYAEMVIPANSGSDGNYITYAAHPGHTPTIEGVPRAFSNGWGAGTGRSYIELNGLEMKNGRGSGIFLAGGASYIRIIDCDIHNFTLSGIEVQQGQDGTSHIYIDGCKSYENGSTPEGGHGIIFYYGGDNSQVINCYCYNNGRGVPQTWASGIEICGAHNISIEDCECYGNDNHGFDICGVSANNSVVNCKSYDNMAVGVALDSGAYDSEVSYNEIYNNGTLGNWGAGVYIWQGDYQDAPHDNLIAYNTIYGNRGSTGTSAGIAVEDTASKAMIFRKNVTYDNERWAMYIHDPSNLAESDYNVFMEDSIRYAGRTYDLAGYQVASEQDKHSSTQLPDEPGNGGGNVMPVITDLEETKAALEQRQADLLIEVAALTVEIDKLQVSIDQLRIIDDELDSAADAIEAD